MDYIDIHKQKQYINKKRKNNISTKNEKTIYQQQMGSSVSIHVTDLENNDAWKKHKIEDVIEYLTESKFLIDTLEIMKYYDFLSSVNYGWKYLDTPSGNHLLASPNGHKWLGTTNGMEWVSSSNGWLWLNAKYRYLRCTAFACGHLEYLDYKESTKSKPKRKCSKCSDTDCQWLEIYDGENWLETENGQKWLYTIHGQKYVTNVIEKKTLSYFRAAYFVKWLCSEAGWNWILTTETGKKYFNSNDFLGLLLQHKSFILLCDSGIGKKYFSTEVGWKWILSNRDFLTQTNFLTTKQGKDWIKSNYGFALLTNDTSFGKNMHSCMKNVYVWLASDDGQDWLTTQKGQEFLSSSGGFAFLIEKAGIKYIEKNINWLQSNDGRRFKKYIERCAHADSNFMTTEFAKVIYERGFDTYFFPSSVPMITATQSTTPMALGYTLA
jgi:hypothetical protein